MLVPSVAEQVGGKGRAGVRGVVHDAEMLSFRSLQAVWLDYKGEGGDEVGTRLELQGWRGEGGNCVVAGGLQADADLIMSEVFAVTILVLCMAERRSRIVLGNVTPVLGTRESLVNIGAERMKRWWGARAHCEWWGGVADMLQPMRRFR